MKKNLYILFFVTALNATDYFARVEPVEIYHIKSSVSAMVLNIDRSLEGRESNQKTIVKLDDRVDLADLNSTKQQLGLIEESISLFQKMIRENKESLRIAQDAYNRVKNLQSYTKVQKDAKKLALINAKKALLSSQKTLQDLISQKSSLELKKETLKDRIAKKNISAKKGEYIYKIYPNRGDFVTMGAPLVDLYDLSHGKLTLYIKDDEIDNIKDKDIYIDGKKSSYKIDKLWRVADSKEISSYKAQIIIDNKLRFSKLVKIEFK